MPEVDSKKFISNILIVFGAFIGWYIFSLYTGMIISELVQADISNQIYQILFLSGFGAATWFFVVKAKKFNEHINGIKEINSSISSWMKIIRKIQVFFGWLIILFVSYTIYEEVKEIFNILY